MHICTELALQVGLSEVYICAWKLHFLLPHPAPPHTHTHSPSQPGGYVMVTQSYSTFCDPMDYTIHGILQARIPEWVAFSFLPQGIFPAMQLLQHCRRILYQLSHKGRLAVCKLHRK